MKLKHLLKRDFKLKDVEGQHLQTFLPPEYSVKTLPNSEIGNKGS